MKVVAIIALALIGAASAQSEMAEIIEARAASEAAMRTLDHMPKMDKFIKEKMEELNAQQTLDGLFNMTSSVTWTPLAQYGGQALTFMNETAVPYAIALLIIVGIYYAVFSFVSLMLNSKMQVYGLARDFMRSNMDNLFTAEAASEAATQLADVVQTAVDRMGFFYGDN